MRIGTVAFLACGAAMATLGLSCHQAQAQTAAAVMSSPRHAPHQRTTEMSAQRRTHRPPTRLRIHPRYAPDDVYPRYNPGPNAVRDCTATYVQEFRPSGTVIVPRLHCFWRPG
jgi:hypothetical protein